MNLWNARHRLINKLFKCKPKTIVLDVDDTVLQWWEGFISAPDNVEFNENKFISNCNKSRDEWDRAIEAFNSSKRFSTLQFMPGAARFVHSLLDQGYRVVFLSACGASKKLYDMRVKNLSKALKIKKSDFKLVTIPVGSSKVDTMGLLLCNYDVKLFVDDMKPHCDAIRNKFNIPSVFYCGCYTGGLWIKAWHYGVDCSSDMDYMSENISNILHSFNYTEFAPGFEYMPSIMRSLSLT